MLNYTEAAPCKFGYPIQLEFKTHTVSVFLIDLENKLKSTDPMIGFILEICDKNQTFAKFKIYSEAYIALDTMRPLLHDFYH